MSISSPQRCRAEAASAGERARASSIRLKPGASMEDVGLALGEICNVVKNTYGGDKGGFIAG